MLFLYTCILHYILICKHKAVEITNDDALRVLQDLQEKYLINIITKPDLNSPVFPGASLTTEEFIAFILQRESGSSRSLQETKRNGQKRENNC